MANQSFYVLPYHSYIMSIIWEQSKFPASYLREAILLCTERMTTFPQEHQPCIFLFIHPHTGN